MDLYAYTTDFMSQGGLVRPPKMTHCPHCDAPLYKTTDLGFCFSLTCSQRRQYFTHHHLNALAQVIKDDHLPTPIHASIIDHIAMHKPTTPHLWWFLRNTDPIHLYGFFGVPHTWIHPVMTSMPAFMTLQEGIQWLDHHYDYAEESIRLGVRALLHSLFQVNLRTLVALCCHIRQEDHVTLDQLYHNYLLKSSKL